MQIFDTIASMGHEQVTLCHDPAAGYRGIIAIHSTVLGPALGGTRFWSYATDDEAIVDALRLARGMTYKNAVAGLNLVLIRLLTRRTGEPVRQFVSSMSTPADAPMPEQRPWRGVGYWLGAYIVLVGLGSLDSITAGAYRPLAITIMVLAEIGWYYAYRRFTRVHPN